MKSQARSTSSRITYTFGILLILASLLLAAFSSWPATSGAKTIPDGIEGGIEISALFYDSGESVSPVTKAALTFASHETGIAVDHLRLIKQDAITDPSTGDLYSGFWVFDYEKQECVEKLVMDMSGRVMTYDRFVELKAQTYREKYGKLSEGLFSLLESKQADDIVDILIWLDCPGAEVSAQKVAAKYPEAGLEGTRYTGKTDPELYENTILPEMNQARQEAYDQCQEPVIKLIQDSGFRIISDCQGIPIIHAKVAKSVIDSIQSLPQVSMIYENSVVTPGSQISAKAIGADIEWGKGIVGQGIKVAVIEADGVDFSHDALPDGSYADPDNPAIDMWDGHATWVAGVLASTDPANKGIASPVLISGNCPANSFEAYKLATLWSINQGPNTKGEYIGARNAADILNCSFGTESSGETTVWDRFYDYIVETYGKTVIAITHNDTSWVASPGLGYNVITVGAYDDRKTPEWADDTIYTKSNYLEKGDNNKPEVVAPGVAIHTTCLENGWADASGSSFAAPHVAGMAALMMQRDPHLCYEPEVVKAIIMASAVNPLAGETNRGPDLEDRMGAGGVSAEYAGKILENGTYLPVSVSAKNFDSNNRFYPASIQAQKGEVVRVVISWLSHTTGDNPSNLTDQVTNDFDLYVEDSNFNHIGGSWTVGTNYEVAQIVAPYTGTFHISVKANPSFQPLPPGSVSSVERIGIAWGKVPSRNSGSSVKSGLIRSANSFLAAKTTSDGVSVSLSGSNRPLQQAACLTTDVWQSRTINVKVCFKNNGLQPALWISSHKRLDSS